jgi:hypothetical protein
MGNEELPVYTLDNLELTERFGKEVLGVSQKSNLTFDECFQQLREHYPLKTPSGRRLHHDLERSKRLYKALIFKVGRVDDKLHSLILQCTNFIVKEKTKTNSLEYLKMLPTYLQQQEWTTVQEEVEKMIKNNQYVDKFSQSDSGGNLENKTILGSSDF